MIYLKADKGDLFCYDAQTLTTLRLKNGEWEVSELTYAALMSEDSVSIVTEKQANEISKGKSPESIIEQIQNVLN